MSPPTASHEHYAATSRLPAVDGLRAVAAALVVAHHSLGQINYLSRSVGVTCFFVVSGFVITRSLVREKARSGTISLGRFQVRRVLRIFPLYYLVLGIYVLLVAVREQGTPEGVAFWRSLPAFLTFTTNWFVAWTPGARVIFYFAWSMAVQEQFYLLWPAILRRIRLRRWAAFVPLAFLGSSELATWLSPSAAPGSPVARVIAGVDSPIYYGVLTALALENRTVFAWLERAAGRSWSFPVAVLAMLVPIVWIEEPGPLITLSLCYLLITCALGPGGALRVLDNPVAIYVGRLSYGIYLLHMLVLNLLRYVAPSLPGTSLFLLTLALVVAMAAASHRWFEQPIMRMGEVHGGRRDKAVPPLSGLS